MDEEALRVGAARIARTVGARAGALGAGDVDVTEHLLELRAVTLRALLAGGVERVAAHHRLGARRERGDKAFVDGALDQEARRLGALLALLREDEPEGAGNNGVEVGTSAKTMLGDLPPSSSVTRLRLESAAPCRTRRPTAVLPVNDTPSTP